MCYGVFQLLGCVCAASTNEREISANGHKYRNANHGFRQQTEVPVFFIFHNFQPKCVVPERDKMVPLKTFIVPSSYVGIDSVLGISDNYFNNCSVFFPKLILPSQCLQVT